MVWFDFKHILKFEVVLPFSKPFLESVEIIKIPLHFPAHGSVCLSTYTVSTYSLSPILMQFVAFFRVMLTQKQENLIGGFEQLVTAKWDKRTEGIQK